MNQNGIVITECRHFFELNASRLPEPLTDWERRLIWDTIHFLEVRPERSEWIPWTVVRLAYKLPPSVVGSFEAEYQQSIHFIDDTGEDMLGYTKRNHLYLLSVNLECRRKFDWYQELFEMHGDDINNGYRLFEMHESENDLLILCLRYIKWSVDNLANLGSWATMGDKFTKDSLLNPNGKFVQDLLSEKVLQIKNPNDLESVVYLLDHGYDGLIIVPDSKVLGVLKRNTKKDFPFMFIFEAMAMYREGRDLNEGGYEADDDESDEYYEGTRKKIYL